MMSLQVMKNLNKLPGDEQMKNCKRKSAVQSVIDKKIRTMGGDKLAISASIAVGMTSLKQDPSSACRAIERAVSAGAAMIDGGCYVNS